jgi:hypothetical protein
MTLKHNSLQKYANRPAILELAHDWDEEGNEARPVEQVAPFIDH